MQIIDLNQNAVALVAIATRFSKQMQLDTNAIKKDMISGDHDHLKSVFKLHFKYVCECVDDSDDDGRDDEFLFGN